MPVSGNAWVSEPGMDKALHLLIVELLNLEAVKSPQNGSMIPKPGRPAGHHNRNPIIFMRKFRYLFGDPIIGVIRHHLIERVKHDHAFPFIQFLDQEIARMRKFLLLQLSDKMSMQGAAIPGHVVQGQIEGQR